MTTKKNKDENPMTIFDPDTINVEEVLEASKIRSRFETKAQRNAAATKTEIVAVISEILRTKNIPITTESLTNATCAVAVLCQEGATSPKFKESRINRSFGIAISVKEVRKACTTVGVDTVRKLARGMKDKIFEISQKLCLEGNLSKLYKLDCLDYDPQDLVWVSDFQTFNRNPQMPDKVRQWLLSNYKTRFKPKTTHVKKKVDTKL